MAARRKTKAAPARKTSRTAKKERDDSLPAPHTANARRGRPSWQGHLRLSLVSCPVALYGATTRARDISFHLINPETNNRIKMVPTDPDAGPVSRSDLVRGFEYEKNKYVLIDNEDLQSVRLETTRTIDIERFVEETDIDRVYWNDPYYLVPDGKSGIEAYAVIRDAMRKTGRVAIGRLVMHTRERLVALETRENGILAYTLRSADEVVAARPLFEEIPQEKSDPRMVEIAEKIIDQLEGPFDPSTFEDRYEKALKELIDRKLKGEKPVEAAPVEDTNVIDLMAALKNSLKHKGEAPEPEHGRRAANTNARGRRKAG